MHAYLIIGKDEGAIEEKISLLLKELKTKRFDTIVNKINDVRDLSRFTKLGQSEPISIIIKDIDSASLEALNSFLKSLEEPLENINYILTAKSFSNIPETILSRCKIIRLVGVGDKVNSENFSKKFLNYSLSEKMNYISGVKTKEDTQIFAQTMIIGVHSLLGKSTSSKYAKILKSAEDLLKAIKANGNIQLHLTNFIISLD
jgi:DNA polymerase III delta prime subunit